MHSKEVLEFLVGNAGADRVLLGSDYPFDMGMPDGVLQVAACRSRPPTRRPSWAGGAQALLGAVGAQDIGAARPPDDDLTARMPNERRRRRNNGAAKPPATPGAKRAGAGEYVFDLAKVNHILGGPDYSTANGACVEGDRMIVGLMRMPAGTGAEPHSHPNEQWIYILEGTFRAKIGDKEIEAKPGSVVYVPSERRPLRQGDARRPTWCSSPQGRLAQPARHQGGLTAQRLDGRDNDQRATRSRGRLPVSAAAAWATIDGKPPTVRRSGDPIDS